METSKPDDAMDRLDRATERRLARLRTFQVDTSSLEQRLLAQIPKPTAGGRIRGGWRRLLRAAAVLALVSGLAVALVMSTSGGPALASPTQMAQLHYDMVSGKSPSMQVGSIEAANRMLSKQWSQSPEIPGLPDDHVMTCCMKSIKNKRVACVLLKNEGASVTLTVANAADMKLPSSPTVVHVGVTYHVQSSAGVQMVMTEREGRWICLMSDAPAERLMDLASKLRF